MNCFNGEEFLIYALESVLKQTYQNWELIFWNNKSTDRSLEIISNYHDHRIKVFTSTRHTNLGEARKKALKKAKGEFLAFLDVDDIWTSDKLMQQINVFEDDEIGVSFTNSVYFSEKRKKNLYKSREEINVNTKSLITNYSLSLNSLMIDLKKLNNLHYDFDEKFSHICDFDLIVRLSTISKVKYLNQILSGWRIHGNNESFKRKNLFNKEIKAWCEFHLNNKYLENYYKEIKELELLNSAQSRILSNNFNFPNFKEINFNRTSKAKNFFFILFSYIPILPNFIYKIKDIIFQFKWY